ncbi:MAG: hypothetical protein GDA68_17705 [Nitrospira sp. CR2.1]|nr:hypothetical protein [Nitrospira sp. CR2.1]
MSAPAPTPDTTTPRTFSQTVIRTVPLHLLASIVVVGGCALYSSTSMAGRGLWALVGSWSLTALSLMIAGAGGILAGLLDAAQQTVERVEQQLRAWLHTLPAAVRVDGTTGRPVDSVRAEYETLVEQWATRTGERLRLPRWLETLIRKALRGIIVERFIDSCKERGLSLVAPQEFRNWLLAEGVSLGFMPIQDQLSWWRYLVMGLLGLLASVSLLLMLLAT